MADPKSEVTPAYGEGDIEAKAMEQAAKGDKRPGAAADPPPPDAAVPAAGTTETDLARNLQDKAARQKN